MKHGFSKVFRTLRKLGLNESGAATVELVIVFPFFVGVFLSAFEVAMMNMRAVMLERSTDLVVRQIRLSSGGALNYNKVLEAICENAIIPDCMENTKIELRDVDIENFAGLSAEIDCIKRERPIQPLVNFQNGADGDTMLIRVCAVVDPFFPNLGVGRSMPVDKTGAYQVVASSAFVNEPL